MISRPLHQPLPQQPSVHCATLCQLPDGTLLAAWFGGTRELARDVVILGARLEGGGATWSAPQVLVAVPGQALGQPVFLPLADGRLRLFCNVVPPGERWTSAQPHFQDSANGGRKWGPLQALMDYPGLMFRSKPLHLPGRILLPAYDERAWHSRMLISEDGGESWRLGEPIVSPPGNIHACLVRLDEGGVLAYLRTGGQGGFLWRTVSRDCGESWTPPQPTSISNPNAGLDLIRLAGGDLLLACNPVVRGRTPLALLLASPDENWGEALLLEEGAGEHSYPTLHQARDGMIHMVYTWRRERIQHVCFSETWLRRRLTPSA
ncbi:MAG: exo-alpha-sialidase [Anaerolineaceae bacterium]|nr:exo-alpha-sialidase [Anaerolineaceae bacterium]